ncbi:uncharacterized protein CLAFUR5_20366 [Fulvia fulva]|uniref:uncharacterized protein n=1 Tax=Passalora fulva TaxID=5499 RepID=UPI00285284D2|nr:uncharacterized protein CLAFUR5_20366 [Fulvia fulva]WMI39076.1 hypothetical protein CLAFUR5_20366 [Fulvia fulva]WPV36669.1 hypothetical protein CLAFUW7_13983 [Fulvia fulva]
MDTTTVKHIAASGGDESQCKLFILPAELRNQIYELVLMPSEIKDSIDLPQAAPPSGPLIMTCRRIYHEAGAMYRRVNRDYWTTTHFTMQNTKAEAGDPKGMDAIDAMTETLNHLKDRDLH